MALPQATDGPLAGFTSVDIDLDKLAANKQAAYDAHVPYKFGGKDPRPGQGLIDYTSGIDCSGFVRTLLMYASNGVLDEIPDGSWNEDTFFADQGFKKGDDSDYNADAMNSDGLVRVAVHRANGRGNDSTGHIWIVVNGHTVESYGGHGPGERAWDTQKLLDIVDDFFVVGPLV